MCTCRYKFRWSPKNQCCIASTYRTFKQQLRFSLINVRPLVFLRKRFFLMLYFFIAAWIQERIEKNVSWSPFTSCCPGILSISYSGFYHRCARESYLRGLFTVLCQNYCIRLVFRVYFHVDFILCYVFPILCKCKCSKFLVFQQQVLES